MKKCNYCLSTYFHETDCPISRRIDTLHNNKSLDPEMSYMEPTYGERLNFGFNLLHVDEDCIIDKFGVSHGSGVY